MKKYLLILTMLSFFITEETNVSGKNTNLKIALSKIRLLELSNTFDYGDKIKEEEAWLAKFLSVSSNSRLQDQLNRELYGKNDKLLDVLNVISEAKATININHKINEYVSMVLDLSIEKDNFKITSFLIKFKGDHELGFKKDALSFKMKLNKDIDFKGTIGSIDKLNDKNFFLPLANNNDNSKLFVEKHLGSVLNRIDIEAGLNYKDSGVGFKRKVNSSKNKIKGFVTENNKAVEKDLDTVFYTIANILALNITKNLKVDFEFSNKYHCIEIITKDKELSKVPLVINYSNWSARLLYKKPIEINKYIIEKNVKFIKTRLKFNFSYQYSDLIDKQKEVDPKVHAALNNYFSKTEAEVGGDNKTTQDQANSFSKNFGKAHIFSIDITTAFIFDIMNQLRLKLKAVFFFSRIYSEDLTKKQSTNQSTEQRNNTGIEISMKLSSLKMDLFNTKKTTELDPIKDEPQGPLKKKKPGLKSKQKNAAKSKNIESDRVDCDIFEGDINI